MTEERCEACLGLPGPNQRCPAHPYADLIQIDAAEEDAERALLRDIRRSRRRVFFGGVAASVAAVSFVGAVSGSYVLGDLFASTLMFGVFFPPAALFRAGRQRMTGHPISWPAWWLAGAVTIWWTVWWWVTSLYLGAYFWTELADWITAYTPHIVWTVGVAVWLLSRVYPARPR